MNSAGHSAAGHSAHPSFLDIEVPGEPHTIALCVDEHAIRRYAFTVDNYCDWYVTNSRFGRPIAHPDLLANAMLLAVSRRYGPREELYIHTHNRLEFHRPLGIGQDVSISARYAEKYVRDGGQYLVTTATATAGGLSVLRQRSIELVGAPALGQKSGTGDSRARIHCEYHDAGPLVAGYRPGLPAGAELRPLVKIPQQDQVSVYSRTDEFVRDIHTDLDIARQHGYAGTIVQGLQQSAYLIELATRFFGVSWFSSGLADFRYVQPAFTGVPLTCHARFCGEVPRQNSNARFGELEMWLRDADGRVTTVGWLSAALPTSKVPTSKVPPANEPLTN